MKNGQIEIAGSVVFWNVAAETDRVKLAEKLTEIDQKKAIPHERTAFVAAKQALSKHYRGDKYRVEKLKDSNGLTVERVIRGETENEYEQIAYVLVNDDSGTIDVCRVVDASEPDAASIESKLINDFLEELKLCSANAVGKALARAVESHDGYALRPTGGVYFLPSFKSESFTQVAEIFEACGVAGKTMVHRMEVAKGDQTIRAVHETIRENISTRITEMREELANGLKSAGRKNRTKEVEALVAQTARYESLLDESLEEVRKDLEAVKVQLSMEQVAGAGNLFAGLSLMEAA